MNKTSKDFFESINEFPHSVGIYLTYTLDTEVIDKLTEFSSGTKLILHDFKQGKTIEDNDNSNIICIPVKPLKTTEKNCFHPKLALLKGKDSAKLIVGSANLSRHCFQRDKETALEITLNFKNSSDVYVYNQVLKFFNQLTGETDKEKRQVLPSNNVLETTLKYLRHPGLPEEKSEIEFVFNSENKSIFDELKNYLAQNRDSEKANKIKIATPFVSSSYSKIEEIKAITKNISVYLRTGAKIEPFKENTSEIWQPKKSKKREGFHSKLFLIEYKSDAVLFIGSANFTEQGFFKTLNESANQECGIILKISTEEMNEWFSEAYWKQLTEIEIENYEADDNSLEFLETESDFYAWAEKENNKIVTYIFKPNELPVTKTKDGYIINWVETGNASFFKTDKLEAINQKITFYIGEEKVTIPIFEMSEYMAGLNEKGESIFSTFKGLYSVNPKEMDEAIDKEKLSVSESTTIKISEPPKLEQYFYNVKELLSGIKDKKHFSDYNEKEIQSEINKADDGRTLYLTLQLLKVFSTKENLKTINELFENRLGDLAIKLKIDTKKLKTFKKAWLTSKT